MFFSAENWQRGSLNTKLTKPYANSEKERSFNEESILPLWPDSKKCLKIGKVQEKFPTSYTTSKILENISLALLRSSLRKPYANSLKTKAVNAKTRPRCALVAGLGPLSLLFVCLPSLMEFEIRAEHAQKPRMCRRILGDDEKFGCEKVYRVLFKKWS